MEKLAKLPPVFDRSPTGTLTAGNSSPLTAGAAVVLLMSEGRAQSENREPLAYIKDQLGHSSIKLTVDIYGHLEPGANREAVNRLPSLDAPVSTEDKYVGAK